MRAFVARSRAAYAHLAPDAPIREVRAAYDAMCRAMRAPLPAGLSVVDERAGDVPVRVYGASDTSVLYLHGGGFAMGDLESHDDIVAEIAAAAGLRCIAVGYRLAPEHPYPAAFEDCAEALFWVADRFGPEIVLAGDSAGGSLATALCHAHRSDPRVRIAGQMLIYPALGGDPGRGSHVEHANAPLLTRDDIALYERLHAAPPDAARPLHEPDLAGLPPTVIETAGCDPLRDDGRDYAARLADAGVPSLWRNEPGLVHGWLRARHGASVARRAFSRIVGAIAALSRGVLPDRG